MGTVTKIWYGIGTCVALSNPGASSAADHDGVGSKVESTDDFPGGFDKALEKIFAGEGGEGGRGLTKMLPSVTSPALHGFQIEKALTGNTLHSFGASALHYNASGQLAGWVGSWALISPNACPAKPASGDTYFQGAKGCYKLSKHEATGTWTVKDDQLCQSFTADGKSTTGCSYVALLLDTFALFDSATGVMSGKGFKLLVGKQIG